MTLDAPSSACLRAELFPTTPSFRWWGPGLYASRMLIIAIILFGMIIGAAAQLILGKSSAGIDWSLAFAAGIIGSFVGGLLISLIAGDGIHLRASGIVGSVVGAVIVTAGWRWWQARSSTAS
ncbi:MAG: putative integral rane protein [Nocardioidaceae bacterium]|nr:putative integral rane protein [Nocardioidaceae bacterium]